MTDLIRSIIKWIPEAEHGVELVARRPASHPKGKKVLMRIDVGEPIPPGVILGKGTRLSIERKQEPQTEGVNDV